MAKIYVGTYAKYNAGSIEGAWLDCEDYSSAQEFLTACAELHKDESDPELMFQDMEDIPAGMASESHIDAALWDWLELDEDDQKLLAIYRANVDESGTLETARDEFRGKANTKEDFAAQYWEDCGMLEGVQDSVLNYIDYEKVARDMGFEGMSFIYENGEYWVFG